MDKMLYAIFRKLSSKNATFRNILHKIVREDIKKADGEKPDWLRDTLETAISGIIADDEALENLLTHPDLPPVLHVSSKGWAAFRKLLRQEIVSKKLLSSGFVQESLNKNPLPGHLANSPAAMQALVELLNRPGVRKALQNHESVSASLSEKANELRKSNGLALEHLAGFAAFQVFWDKIKTDLSPEIKVDVNIAQIANELETRNLTRKVFYAHFCNGDILRMKRGEFTLPDHYSFWVQLFELFINEDYYFECDSDAPNIIDAGTHMGLAIYYFKTRFPDATVTAFEPNPPMREIAMKNINNCGFDKVEILPYALSDAEKTVSFFIHKNDTMAASLEIQQRGGEEGEMIDVECRKLSDWLDQPVDFLKMDIEGEEDKVLKECSDHLYNVHHLFCEYHHGNGLANNRLAKILQLLDEEGFDFQVGKSWGYQDSTHVRPFNYVTQPYSAIIWAKNRTWPPPEQS